MKPQPGKDLKAKTNGGHTSGRREQQPTHGPLLCPAALWGVMEAGDVIAANNSNNRRLQLLQQARSMFTMLLVLSTRYKTILESCDGSGYSSVCVCVRVCACARDCVLCVAVSLPTHNIKTVFKICADSLESEEFLSVYRTATRFSNH